MMSMTLSDAVAILLYFWACTCTLGVDAARDKELYCGACHMLVDQIEWEIEQTDPRKTIQIGSFRIKPDGSQQLNEIPYKRSGVQISELVEEVCSHSRDYLQVSEEGSERKLYRRQSRRDNQPSSSSQVVFSKETHKMLKFACENLAEDYEDDLVEEFKKTYAARRDYLSHICVETMKVCAEDHLYDVEPPVADLNSVDDDKSKQESEDETSAESGDEDNASSTEDRNGHEDKDSTDDSIQDTVGSQVIDKAEL